VSDQEDKNIEQIVEESEAEQAAAEESAAISEDAAPLAPAAASAPARATEPAPQKKASSAVAWLALLLVLGLAAGAAWYIMQLQQRETALLARLADVESLAGARDDNVQQLGDRWDRDLQSGLGRLEDELEGGLSGLRGEAEQQARAVQEFDDQLADLRAELARFSAVDRKSWLLAEAEYLLRLANQRLIMAGDAESAQVLMSSADKILRELDEAALHDARGAVAADLAAVRAVPSVDVEGIYLRLAALVEQAGQLVIFQMPDAEPRLEQAPADDWQDRLQQGYESALLKLSDYIVIRRRDVPMQTLMDPQWEGLVRQNLRMLLEQAQVALLSGNQTLYAESLQRANHWVAEFFESDESAARAMASEIDQLADLRIAVEMPDISRSLSALDDAIERRLEQGGAE
jgi:uroporphyrin-3 C-methyltransferase